MVAFFMSLGAFTQSPQRMSYQCVVRSTTGALVLNSPVGVRISILQGSENGSVIYQETYNPNPRTNANGLLIIEIGSGLVIVGGQFSSINWGAGPYYLKTETDPGGGTNYNIIGVSQLLSVPFALYANTAGNALSVSFSDLSNKPSTLSGYGITDGINTTHPANGITSPMIINWNTAFQWGDHQGLYKLINYVPSWTEISSKPTTIGGFGITDAVTLAGDQSISGVKSFDGKVKVLAPFENTDAVNKEYVDAIIQKIDKLEAIMAINGISIPEETVVDVEGNIYRVVSIGTQKWMADNLKTTKYSDGSSIGTYYWYLNNESGYKSSYGALYPWEVVSSNQICPSGWHVPGIDEWTQLLTFFGGAEFPGGKLREIGTIHWVDFNPARITNETGFNAVGNGWRRSVDGVFDQLGWASYLWSSTQDDLEAANAKFVTITSSGILNVGNTVLKSYGLAIRCVKD